MFDQMPLRRLDGVLEVVQGDRWRVRRGILREGLGLWGAVWLRG